MSYHTDGRDSRCSLGEPDAANHAHTGHRPVDQEDERTQGKPSVRHVLDGIARRLDGKHPDRSLAIQFVLEGDAISLMRDDAETAQQFSIWKCHRRAVACSGSRVALLSTSRLKGGAWEANSTLQQAPGWQSHREFTKNQGQLHGKSRLQALHRLWFDGNLLVRAMFSTRCCDSSAILRTAAKHALARFDLWADPGMILALADFIIEEKASSWTQLDGLRSEERSLI